MLNKDWTWWSKSLLHLLLLKWTTEERKPDWVDINWRIYFFKLHGPSAVIRFPGSLREGACRRTGHEPGSLCAPSRLHTRPGSWAFLFTSVFLLYIHVGFEKILKTVADRRQRNDWSSINPPVLSLKITNSPLWNDPDHSLGFSSFTRQPSTTGGAVVTFMGISLLRTKDNLNSNQALQAFIRRMWHIHVFELHVTMWLFFKCSIVTFMASCTPAGPPLGYHC